jgi:ribosomal protein S12 methylthiotransferase accessory factor YcaO
MRAELVGVSAGPTVESHGKGVGRQLLASTLFELVEHAVIEHVIPPDHLPVLVARADLYDRGRLVRDAVSLNVYRNAEEQVAAFPYVSCDLDAERKAYWVPCVDSQLVDPPEPRTARALLHHYFESSTGWAAGMSLEGALLHALYEVIERDSYSELLLASADGHSFGSPVRPRADSDLEALAATVESSTQSALSLRLLPALAGVCVAASSDRTDKFGRKLVGLGVSWSPDEAAERAVLEYEQECAAEELSLTYAADSPYVERRYLDSYPYLRQAELLSALPAAAAETAFADELAPVEVPTPADQLRLVCERLRRGGYEPVYRVVWKAQEFADDCPIVVQALIPGAERFHMVRHGIPMEPIGRLRSDEVVGKCRARRWD